MSAWSPHEGQGNAEKSAARGKIDGGLGGFDPPGAVVDPPGKVPKWGWGVGFGQFSAK